MVPAPVVGPISQQEALYSAAIRRDLLLIVPTVAANVVAVGGKVQSVL